MLTHLLKVKWVQEKTEQVRASERWVEILGTVQYTDQDRLNGVLVSNKWPPLWNARRVGFGVLIYVYERANLGAEHTHADAHTILSDHVKRGSSPRPNLTQFIHTVSFLSSEGPFLTQPSPLWRASFKAAFRIHRRLLQKKISSSLARSKWTKLSCTCNKLLTHKQRSSPLPCSFVPATSYFIYAALLKREY